MSDGQQDSSAPRSGEPLSTRRVWEMYRDNPTDAMRNTLIERHLHIVERIAARLRTRLPAQVEVGDLISAGSFGLTDAVESYDPGRNVKFATFCQRRIRGAMVDELRTQDWASRTVRGRQGRLAEVRRQIEVECGRPATRDEIISRLGVTEAEFRRIERDAAPVAVTSLDRKVHGSAGEERAMELASAGESPLRAAQRKDALDMITRRLSRAERLIVVLYYYEGLTMREIGLTLALSESRVSQLHTQILQQLRVQLASRAPELEPIG